MEGRTELAPGDLVRAHPVLVPPADDPEAIPFALWVHRASSGSLEAATELDGTSLCLVLCVIPRGTAGSTEVLLLANGTYGWALDREVVLVARAGNG